MKLGLEREDAAAQRYKLQKQLEGEELTIREAGFRVAEKGFLGASVDRIATDASGRQILVELKNPDNTWEFQSITDIPQKQKCLVRSACGQVELSKTHSFYTQIQGQMFVYGTDCCDFVLCTKHTMLIERVPRNDNFIAHMTEKLESFYDNVYLPESVYPQVKYGASPLDLRKYE